MSCGSTRCRRSGAFAIQLAKRAGRHVVGVDNAAELEFMRSLGADEVIDYRSDDFTRGHEPYDLILDPHRPDVRPRPRAVCIAHVGGGSALGKVVVEIT